MLTRLSLLASGLSVAAGECAGAGCRLLSVSTPTRPEIEQTEEEPYLGINTFQAVDQCANAEVSRLTNWILDYYADVSTQLDQSFSNILQIGRLAASALTHLSELSLELHKYQSVANITSEMNAMLRTCLADYSALTNSMLKCPMAFDASAAVPNSTMTLDQSAGMLTEATHLEGTCLETLCVHIQTFQVTCGSEGFIRDLQELAASHEMEGSSARYLSRRDSQFVGAPLQQLYGPNDDSSTYAMLGEDLLTQEYGLMQRVQLTVDLWTRWMFVTVRKNLRGAMWTQADDATVCKKLGFEPPLANYHLIVKLQTCEGGHKIRDILIDHNQKEVVAFVSKMLKQLNAAMEGKVIDQNTGIVYAGKLTNICAHYERDFEPLVDEFINILQADHDKMFPDGKMPGAPDKFYQADITKVGDPDNHQAFNGQSGPTQNFGMAAVDLMPPMGLR